MFPDINLLPSPIFMRKTQAREPNVGEDGAKSECVTIYDVFDATYGYIF